jgi:hypothetical protein
MHRRLLPLIIAPILLFGVLGATPALAASPCASLATIRPIAAISQPTSASPAYVAKIRADSVLVHRDEVLLKSLASRLGTAKAATLRAAADFTRLYNNEIALYHTAQSLAANPSSSTARAAVASRVRIANSAAITASFAVANLRANADACR